MSWAGPQRGDVLEIAADWHGPSVHGQDDGTWLSVAAGEQVTVIDLGQDGRMYVRTSAATRGWLGGPGCVGRVTLEFDIGPHEPVGRHAKRQRLGASQAFAAGDMPPPSGRPPVPAGDIVPPPPTRPHPMYPHAQQHASGTGRPLEPEILQLIEQRNIARKNSDFGTADRIRDSLKARGVMLSDEKGASGLGQEVTTWRYLDGDLPPPPRQPQAQPLPQRLPPQLPPPQPQVRPNPQMQMRPQPLPARPQLVPPPQPVHMVRPLPPPPSMSREMARPLPPPPSVPRETARQPPPPSVPHPALSLPSEPEIVQLIEQRNQARKANDFRTADAIRDGLKARGVVLTDEKGVKGDHLGQDVTTWRYWNVDNSPVRQEAFPAAAVGRPSEQEILQLIDERNLARKAGDYARSDAIRDGLHSRGVVLQDERGTGKTTFRYWQNDAPPR